MNVRRIKIIPLFLVCLLLFISESNAQNTLDERRIKVSLRMIGHQVLLHLGDSTSRVMPILKEKDRYIIPFETALEFNPENLVETINEVVKERKIAEHYILEVEDCETKGIVYSFEVDNLEELNINSCNDRTLPKSCYQLLFTLITPQNSKFYVASSVENYMMLLILFGLIGLVAFLLWMRKKKSTTDPNLIALGEYHFDQQNTALLINGQKTELTNKEANLLLLLYNEVNTTVKREVILNKVWEDEGDYVGRTLDVFISKLRKKLKADEKVKIVNSRGVGYKLVIEV